MKIKLNANISPMPEEAVDSLLIQRGVKDIVNYKNPSVKCELDYDLLDNIEAGARLLINMLEADKRICFVVDADCDGFTSSAILWNYIKDNKWQNAKLSFMVQDGKRHGLEHVVEDLIAANYDLVIAPDSSTNDLLEFDMLNDAGITLLVLDHHQAEYEGYDKLPNNVIVINNQMSNNYSNKNLCGAGVVYKFCEKMDSILGNCDAPKYLDLVALGEIADAVNKTDVETNWLIQAGLKNIQNDGIKQILESLEFSLGSKSYAPYIKLNSMDVGFYIAPMVNAITRIGTVANNEAMFKSFTTPFELVQSTKRGAKPGDKETVIEQVIRTAANCKRQQNAIKEKAIEYIVAQIEKDGKQDDRILVVEIDDESIPSSMTGLIANNIVSKYQRPVLLGRSDGNNLRGSIRGNDNFSAIPQLKEFLESTGYFDMVAGHSNAAGYSLPLKNVDTFVEYCNKKFTKEDFDICYHVDFDLYADDARLIMLFNNLCAHDEYWGNAVDEAYVSIKNLPLDEVAFMGANKDSTKINYNGIDYVRFKDSNFVDEINFGDTHFINVVGRVKLNEFRGKISLQFIIDDYEFVEEDIAHSYDF